MGRSANQKRKVLLVERMLLHTDEGHPISMREMIDRLAGEGIQAERKSIYGDLEELRAVGMEIHFQKGRPTGYYLAEMRMDADSRALIETLEGIGESTKAVPKACENEVDGAVQDHTTEELTKKADAEQIIEEKEVRYWREPEGEYREIQLKCKKSVLKRLTGRYGENCRILKEDEKQVTVQIAEAADNDFYGWLVSQGGAIRPVKPKEIVKEYRKLLKKILEAYK